MSESTIMRSIQIAASNEGHRLFRNTVGVLQDRNGKYVRYGLCPGSSDLIGWRADGRFLAIEVKANTKATDEQVAFIDAVRAAGGLAGIAHSVDEARKIWMGQ